MYKNNYKIKTRISGGYHHFYLGFHVIGHARLYPYLYNISTDMVSLVWNSIWIMYDLNNSESLRISWIIYLFSGENTNEVDVMSYGEFVAFDGKQAEYVFIITIVNSWGTLN